MIFWLNPCIYVMFICCHSLSLGDLIIQQFSEMLSQVVRNEEFQSFEPFKKRLDVFLGRFISGSYPQLWSFIQKLLLLSHSQATVERAFSEVPLTPEMLSPVSSARSRCRIHLENEQRKKESQAQGEKRKAIEEHLEQLKKTRRFV